MFRTVTLIFAIVFLCFSHEVSFGQIQTEKDSQQLTIKNTVSLYYKSLGEQSGIYRGTGYIGYPYQVSNGHQFFESPDFSKGTIFYDGMLYQDIPMWYDLVKDQIVVQSLDSLSMISLHNERIDYFSLFGHDFKKISQDSSNSNSLTTGFYDHIYSGKTEVLVRRYKGTLEDVSPEGIFTKILKQKNEIYLKKEGKYYSVASSGSVVKALGNHQKEVLSQLKKNNVKFKKDPEKATVMMVMYYDQLSN
ncbi:hypothetical protein SAMN05421813_101266 [Daejeonella rubra]|uniref:Uncharacterized protein n=1 Tax=Daejeonella rubra TaxID=990371 RepID=A0A1G9M6W9_9SPHI|nr:hypothetical protein [Daejeonella rubra]SDL69989.1 hypothetical protein SAMN05421813_101266 [Daejeonella rubra]